MTNEILKCSLTKMCENASDYSYLIYKSGYYYYAKNGTSGGNDYSGIDTVAVIQNAIDALISGGTIFVKGASYQINSNLNIGDNINIIGEGIATKFLLGPSGHIVVYGHSNIKISDIYIDGTNQTNSSDPPAGNSGHLSLINANNVVIDHIIIDAKRFAINIYNTDDTIIQNCILNGQGNNDIIGGSSDNGSLKVLNIIVRNNIIKQDASIGALYDCCFDIAGEYRVSVINNMCYGRIIVGGETGPNNYILFSENMLKPAKGKTACEIDVYTAGQTTYRTQYISIINNIIENGAIYVQGIDALRTMYCSINNNLIDATISNNPAITLVYCTLCTISNNIMKGGNKWANIYLKNSDKMVITGNIIIGTNVGIDESTSNGNNIITNNYFQSVTTPVYGQQPTSLVNNNKTT